MRFTIWRALVGDIRMNLAVAIASCASAAYLPCHFSLPDLRRSSRCHRASEGTGGGELPELVPDHRLGDVDGTCLRPSCTAIVWPTISGSTVDRLDHVLMTRFSFLRFISLTFTRRWSSTNGPFLRLLGTTTYPFSCRDGERSWRPRPSSSVCAPRVCPRG